MRSTSRLENEADRTLRARIRDAAIHLIGEQGFERTTVRQIAEVAGVSPGLIIHHFDSKDGLRADCDEHVIDELVALKAGDTTASLGRWLNDTGRYQSMLDYLARLIREDSPASAGLYDRMASEAASIHQKGVEAGTFTATSDPEATAVLLTNYALSSLLLGHHLRRHLGEEQSGANQRLALAQSEVFSGGLFADDSIRRAMGDAFTPEDTPEEGTRR